MAMLLLLGSSGVDGAPSQAVADLCRHENATRRTTARADVVFAIRGGGFRRRPGQAMIQPCCPSDQDARRVFMSMLTFINKLKTHGFGETRVLATTYGCPSGGPQYTQELREWYEPYLRDASNWNMLPHLSKEHVQHKAASGDGLWTQSRFVLNELQARLVPVVTNKPPKLLVMHRADEMIMVRNWTLFRECLEEGPLGDIVPGPFARCYASWDNSEAPTLVTDMRTFFGLGAARRACVENVVTKQIRGPCVADDNFLNHAWMHRAPESPGG